MITIIAFFSGAALSACVSALYGLRQLSKLGQDVHTAIDAWKQVAEVKNGND